MERTDPVSPLLFCRWGRVPGSSAPCALPVSGAGAGREEEPRRGRSALPGPGVIYEVLKSIFEAVIYLTALSLNKHRIRLIIVTVETQHPNLAVAASPSPALQRPGLGASPARSCTLAAAFAPAFQHGHSCPGALYGPPAFPLVPRSSRAHSCAPQCTSQTRICQEQRHHPHPTRKGHLLHPAICGKVWRAPLPWLFPLFPCPGSFFGSSLAQGIPTRSRELSVVDQIRKGRGVVVGSSVSL